MATFGKKLRECREAKGFSQSKLAQELGLHHSIIGRYERDEAKPTIDVVKGMSKALNTTVGYLLGETSDALMIKDPVMLERFQEISNLPDEDKKCVYSLLDAYLAKNKLKALIK
ncbi:MAG: helix-turn-helix domain-containing protein [Cytophagaceae bacterium]|nr:helix-turn-helix domain-containing protein [Cytophagaceae bacterium]